MFSCLCRIVAGQTARRNHFWSRIAFLGWLLWEIPGLQPWCLIYSPLHELVLRLLSLQTGERLEQGNLG